MPTGVELVPAVPHLDPLWLFFVVFVATALAGVAALLRSSTALSVRSILTWSLNSGLVGLGLFWFWQKYYAADVWGLLGICILVGLGGPTSVDLVVNLARKTVTTVAGQITATGDEKDKGNGNADKPTDTPS